MYTNTIPICYVVIQNKDRYLLVEKQYPSMKNHTWNFLREDVRLGESYQEAAKRIAKEKVNLDIQLTGIVKVLYQTMLSTKPETIHIVVAFYATTNLPEKLSLRDNIVSIKWVTKEELTLSAVPKNFGGPQSIYIAKCVLNNEKHLLSLLDTRI